MKNYGDRICTVCGVGFTARNPNQLTCGEACRRARHHERQRARGRQQFVCACGGTPSRGAVRCRACVQQTALAARTCGHCGQTFSRRRWDKDSLKFCSRDCAFAHRKAGKPGRQAARLARLAAERAAYLATFPKCPCCDGRVNRTSKICWNRACASAREYHRIKGREAYRRHHKAVDEVPNCLSCGKSLADRGWKHGRPRLCCSRRCSRQMLRRYQKYWSGLTGEARVEMARTAAVLKAFNRLRSDVNRGNPIGEYLWLQQ